MESCRFEVTQVTSQPGSARAGTFSQRQVICDWLVQSPEIGGPPVDIRSEHWHFGQVAAMNPNAGQRPTTQMPR